MIWAQIINNIRRLLSKVITQKSSFFEIRIPNQTTIDALEEAEQKYTSLKSYDSVQTMFKEFD